MPEDTARRFAHVTFAALSDVGRKRANNEDSHGEWPVQGVFCVADGMGGAEDGEVASGAIVETLGAMLPRWDAYDPPVAAPDRLAAIDRAVDAASARIRDYAETHGKSGCGSTVVAVFLDPANPSRAFALHAGDSRAYRLRRHRLAQITRDHSVANLVGARDERDIAPALRSLVLRAVGIASDVDLERTPFDLAEDDWILLCSDGLSRMVSDRDIARLLADAPSPDAAASALVAAANEAGGEDNVTVVVLRIGPLPQPPFPVRERLSTAEADALFDGIPFSAPRTASPPDSEDSDGASAPDRPDEESAAASPREPERPVVARLRRLFLRHRRTAPFLVLLVFLLLSALVGFAAARLRTLFVSEASVRTSQPAPPPLP